MATARAAAPSRARAVRRREERARAAGPRVASLREEPETHLVEVQLPALEGKQTKEVRKVELAARALAKVPVWNSGTARARNQERDTNFVQLMPIARVTGRAVETHRTMVHRHARPVLWPAPHRVARRMKSARGAGAAFRAHVR